MRLTCASQLTLFLIRTKDKNLWIFKLLPTFTNRVRSFRVVPKLTFILLLLNYVFVSRICEKEKIIYWIIVLQLFRAVHKFPIFLLHSNGNLINLRLMSEIKSRLGKQNLVSNGRNRFPINIENCFSMEINWVKSLSR